MATPRSDELRALAQRLADEWSDVEMLVVTTDQLGLDDAFAGSGLPEPQSWGPQGTPSHRVFGYRDGVPVEQIWWSRALAAERLESAAEAIVNGIVLRTRGLAAAWQERLRNYPDDLAVERIEEAASTWGGYAPESVLTVTRSDARLPRVQRMVGDAERIVRIVFAINRTWEPTLERLALRLEPLAVKPERLAERLDAAFAADGSNVVRARAWLAASAEALRR